MKSCKNAMLLFVAIFILSWCRGQSSFPEEIAKQFTEHTENALPEKVFVHTDKNFYLTGEILWLKIYAVDGLLHRPLDLSKVAYVELFDNTDKPSLKGKIAIKEGKGSGSLYLPLTLNSGVYKLRAYTNWMKNSGEDYFFEKTITVVNGRKTYVEEKRPPLPEFDIQFFPEGGNLVNGLSSRIGFRVVDKYGRGVECRGLLVDDQTDTLLSFAPLHAGLGHFQLTPQNGRNYKAVIDVPGLGQMIRALPVAYDNGYVMRVSQPVNGKVLISVQASLKPAPSTDPRVYLFAHTRGLVKSVLTANISNGYAQFEMDIKTLGEGISHFTLFNAGRQPVCERLLFKYPSRNLQVSMTSGKEYGVRKKVEIGFTTRGNDNLPVSADLSMAVYRLDSLQPMDGMNISNYLWLSADLPGTVESPEYYFASPQDTTVIAAMDNLMLTNGWRRFSWSDLLADAKPAFRFVPEYNGHFISGKITNAGTQMPGTNISAFLAVPGRRTQFHESIGDNNGNVKFEMKDFYGEEVIVQTNGQIDSLYRVALSDPFFDKYSHNSFPRFSMASVPPVTLLERYIGAQAQNIYSGSRLAQFEVPAIDTNTFYVKPDAKYLLDDYTRFTTIEEVLREYVPLVFVRKRAGRFHFAVFESARRILYSMDPLVLLDGVPVFNIDKFMKYDPLKIWKLELIAHSYYHGGLAYDGVLNFITYRGDLPDAELDPNATLIDYEGLQMQREFFSPVYETPEQVAGKAPDLRNLLLWSPDIKTNSKANGRLSFYTSDLPGRYAIILQGISADGQAGSETVTFDVK